MVDLLELFGSLELSQCGDLVLGLLTGCVEDVPLLLSL